MEKLESSPTDSESRAFIESKPKTITQSPTPKNFVRDFARFKIVRAVARAEQNLKILKL
ncbi:hypothetical protein [uncultured Helicobacter sp.]|uniref:hypothetical protein n=1 Tax=uncultured Helicobacter sp. TaxID=175537 RepID=UPI003752E4BA